MMTSRHTLNKEQGAVLIIALIFLLVLSFIGVSSMQGTTMQEKMSGNLRDRNSAFNAAEAGLREGEAQARSDYYSGALDADNSSTGSYTSSFSSSEAPEWNAELMADIYVSLKAGEDPAGAVIKVQSSSEGFSGKSNVLLESIYVVEQ
ncbi:PilX N-terminal domain-containing pilus assembly protein [uncultured Amphritea sp.]|uniref:pilus assembly PilX family protein n=1 Tax=uncultured Amphritea sp. TaxID=981605 RepID=UPI0026208919|nr:PilX N-terminal domain-containing pilus assembly protein [uncultured Amphritea sp.]